MQIREGFSQLTLTILFAIELEIFFPTARALIGYVSESARL